MKRAAFAAFRRLPRRLRIATIHAFTPSFTVGVVLILTRDNGDLLLVEQRHTGGWALPGGLLARREDPYDGIVREVAEEVGLTLEPARLPTPYAVVTPQVRRVDVVFVCVAAEGVRPRPGEDDAEVTGIGWFALDALPDVTAPTLDILRGARVL